MALTALRPDVGLLKGREVSLLRLSDAFLLISASRVVSSDLQGPLAPRKQTWRTKKLSSL